jgi:hypothetical protein
MKYNYLTKALVLSLFLGQSTNQVSLAQALNIQTSEHVSESQEYIVDELKKIAS